MADPDDVDSEPDQADLLTELAEYGADQRRWLKVLLPILQLRPEESDSRVTVDVALAVQAAAGRVCRICRSDLRDC